MSFEDAAQEALKESFINGWNDALETAAKSFERRKPGTPLDIVMQGIADELRMLMRDTQ